MLPGHVPFLSALQARACSSTASKSDSPRAGGRRRHPGGGARRRRRQGPGAGLRRRTPRRSTATPRQEVASADAELAAGKDWRRIQGPAQPPRLGRRHWTQGATAAGRPYQRPSPALARRGLGPQVRPRSTPRRAGGALAAAQRRASVSARARLVTLLRHLRRAPRARCAGSWPICASAGPEGATGGVSFEGPLRRGPEGLPVVARGHARAAGARGVPRARRRRAVRRRPRGRLARPPGHPGHPGGQRHRARQPGPGPLRLRRPQGQGRGRRRPARPAGRPPRREHRGPRRPLVLHVAGPQARICTWTWRASRCTAAATAWR